MPFHAIDKDLDFEHCGDIHASFDQKMASLEAQINALYELMPFGAYSIATDGTCVSINNQALLWIGCSRESILGKKLPAEKVASANWRHLQHHADQLRRGGLDEIELDLADANGQLRPIGLHAKHLEVPGMSTEMHEVDRFFLI